MSLNKITNEIINKELSEINDSYYLCNYILASYKYLIYQIFTKVNYIYINLLLFLEKYTPKEYEQLSYVIRNEINKYKNIMNYQINISDKDNKELFISKNKYHITKKYDYNSFKNIFNEEPFLKNRFNEVIKKEEDYEKGSNTLRNKILNFFGDKFNIRNTENKDTIKEHLKLIPLSEGLFEEKTILILISGYYSSKDDHYQEWEQLIKVYKSKYKNPIIYFYNWPSSSFSLTKLIFHRKDFRDARERANFCGKLLALMIMSENIFNGFKINISAFSLGNHVLKHCLIELDKFGKLYLINNVIFMAGATDISNNLKWKRILSSIKGCVINCYSDLDVALWLCKIITKKDTIGSKKLKIKGVNISNFIISTFHLLYRIDLYQLWERFIDDLKE